jgi:hypothetical protein
MAGAPMMVAEFLLRTNRPRGLPDAYHAISWTFHDTAVRPARLHIRLSAR